MKKDFLTRGEYWYLRKLIKEITADNIFRYKRTYTWPATPSKLADMRYGAVDVAINVDQPHLSLRIVKLLRASWAHKHTMPKLREINSMEDA